MKPLSPKGLKTAAPFTELTVAQAKAAQEIVRPSGRPRRPASQISDRQAEIVAWVLIYRRINSLWPSYREIMDAFNLASTNSVHLHLAKISAAGFLQYKGARNFVANFDLIRSTDVLSRVYWINRGIILLEDILYLPPNLNLSPAILAQFPQLASAVRNG